VADGILFRGGICGRRRGAGADRDAGEARLSGTAKLRRDRRRSGGRRVPARCGGARQKAGGGGEASVRRFGALREPGAFLF
jgi:hypothetical protein